jgi:hypothetical protein
MLNSWSLGRTIATCVALPVVPLFCSTTAAALPPDPNNSALLYYQACFIWPPDIPRTLNNVQRGGDPNDQVREQLNRSPWPETLELIQAATRLPQCDWGILYSRGQRIPVPVLFSFKRIQILLGIQAKVLAADGQYRSALENCIIMRRFAAHIGDDTFHTWAASESMDGAATSAVRYVLGVLPPDEALLTWLKNQLGSVPGAPWRPEEALPRFRDMDVQEWTAHPGKHKGWREAFLENIEDEGVRERMQHLNESQLFDQALRSFDAALGQALTVLRNDNSYNQKCAEFAQIVDLAWEKARQGDPVATFTDRVENLGKYYRFHVNVMAARNALTNAIEVYLVKARTGHLPEELPPNLPEDPYSGKSFQYEITKEGFVLCCRAKSVDFSDIRQFEFRVQE